MEQTYSKKRAQYYETIKLLTEWILKFVITAYPS